MKKRVLSLCLAGLMAASLTGCGGAGNAAETTAAAGAENSAAALEAGSSEAKEELVFVNYHPRLKSASLCRRNVCPGDAL